MDMNTRGFFEAAEADRVLGLRGKRLADHLSGEIVRIIQKDLLNFLLAEPLIHEDSLTIKESPHVMLRIETIHTILDKFREVVGESYSDVLRIIGEDIGFSFSLDLFGMLQEMPVPIDYEALLSFWCWFDSSASMGKYSYTLDEERKQLTISLNNSFLILGYKNKAHRHCSFFKGYIQSFLRTSFSQWLSWIELTRFQNPEKYFTVMDIHEKPTKNDECIFILELQEENYPKIRKALTQSMGSVRTGDLREAAQKARIALERAVKQPLGYEDDFSLSYGKLLRAYKNEGIKLSFKDWVKAYDTLSDVMHGDKSMDRNTLRSVLFQISKVIAEISKLKLSEEKRKRLIEAKKEYGIFRK